MEEDTDSANELAAKMPPVLFVRNQVVIYRIEGTCARDFLTHIKPCLAVGTDPVTQMDSLNITLPKDSVFKDYHIEEIIKYYIEWKWSPQMIERVVSNKIEDHTRHTEDYQFILKANDKFNILKFFECAEFFGMAAVKAICYLLIGVLIRVDFDNMDSYDLTRRRLCISEPYDLGQETQMRRKYEYFNELGEEEGSEDGEEGEEEDGEEEFGEEEMEAEMDEVPEEFVATEGRED